MLKFGTISEIDAAKGLARVTFRENGIVSNWLPMAVPLSYKDQFQLPYHINQHVYCLMDERCENGVIGGAIYDSKNKPTGGNKNIVKVKFDGGLELEYNRTLKKLTISGASNIKIEATVKIELVAPLITANNIPIP